MAALSTAAWVAHDLGIAVGVGGSLFGRTALEPSVRNIADRVERGRVVHDAWRRYGAIQLGSLAVMAATWFAGRLRLSGREVDSRARALVLAKDILVGASLATAIGAAVSGRSVSARVRDGAVPMNSDGEVADDAPARVRRLGRLTDGLGLANLIAGAGIIAVTAVLAASAGRSARWGVVSRFLR
jgi:uncharacterized membrane protein